MKKILLLPFFICIHLYSFSQEIKISNLVFEGAGIRGIAYCGAIAELEERGLLGDITKVGGTSAGAITALCVSLGYTAEEISEILHSTNFKKFNDGRFFFIGGINRLSKYFGWYRGKKFSKWLDKIIANKTGDANISFEELHQRGFRDPYITATMLDQQKLVILSHLTYPKMRVGDAVRISVSIPFYFEAVFMNDSGAIYNQPRSKEGFHVMADGGLIGNFPIRIFDSVDHRTGNLITANMSTIGFRIDSETQIASDRGDRKLAPLPIRNMKEYTAALYNIIMENLNRQPLCEDDWKRTISISDGNIRPRIRKLSKTEIGLLIKNGREATHSFFEQ